MALESDDMDIREGWLETYLGGNGDYYIAIVSRAPEGHLVRSSVRISTSGGKAPTDVKIAAANLYRAMEKHGLNELYDDPEQKLIL